MSPTNDDRPDDFPAELKPFEAALGSLVPAASRIDRDRLMYLAGSGGATKSLPNRVVRLAGLFWPSAAAAMLLVSLGLGVLVAFRSPAERIVYVDLPATNSNLVISPRIAPPGLDTESRFAPRSVFADAGYLVLRDEVLRRGVDALDVPIHGGKASKPSDVRNRALLNQFLGS